MNADPAVQLRLLDLQAADTRLAQLAHRRRTLPELAELTRTRQAADEAANAVAEARVRGEDVAADQRRLENDVDTVRNRAARDQQRLQTGGLPSRELEQLEHEIATLARRQGVLEDELLEVMEHAEEASGELTDAEARHGALAGERAELERRRDDALAEIDAEQSRVTPEREQVAAEIPAALVTLYDRARTQGGNGAALLRQRRCEGCHIELSGSELAAVRRAEPDEVVRCENCRAVLVRTPESGL